MSAASTDLIVTGLLERGFASVSDFLAPEAVRALADELKFLKDDGEFKRAGIGRMNDHIFSDEIRRDEIIWFEPSKLSAPQAVLWSRLEEVRATINSQLFLGLWDLEGHYALYPPGGFYRRHLDRFRSD